jgi:hypothetical protein
MHRLFRALKEPLLDFLQRSSSNGFRVRFARDARLARCVSRGSIIFVHEQSSLDLHARASA